MKKDSKKLDDQEIQSNFQKEAKNFLLLYRINLKLSLKDTGSIISGILFTILVSIFFVLEFTNIIAVGSSEQYGKYKTLVYTLGSSSLIFHILLNSLYLFKKQVKDGIASIELRAGFKTWKSYLIRVLIILSTALVYITITLFVSIILNLASIKDIKLFFNLHYSQVFFLGFLAFFSTLIMTVAMVLLKTSMATMFAMIYMLVITMAPLITSFKYLYLTDSEKNSNYKTNIRVISGAKFYNQLKSNEELFNDDDGNGKSKTNQLMNDYVKQILLPISSETEKNNPVYNEDYKIEGFSLRHSVKENAVSRSMVLKNSKASHIFTKNLGFGQVYYNYNVFEINKEGTANYLLEGTPIWKILAPINEYVLKKTDGISSNYEGEIPSIFVQSTDNYWNRNVEGKNINIDGFVKQLIKELPDYTNVLKFIQNFYDQYSYILSTSYQKSFWHYGQQSAEYSDILDNALISGQRGDDYNFEFNYYSWDDVYKNLFDDEYGGNQLSFNFRQVDNGLKRKDLPLNNTNAIKHNEDIAAVYKKFPELTIINQLITSLWRMAMDFDIYRKDELDSSLYEYYNAAIASNALRTDIFRHFAAISTGLFSETLYNDLLNISNSGFFQGQFYTIKNIFDFENLSYTNRDIGAAMQPVYQKVKIKTKKEFLIPLAYFVYIVLISPLGYIGYIVFNKKAKL